MPQIYFGGYIYYVFFFFASFSTLEIKTYNFIHRLYLKSCLVICNHVLLNIYYVLIVLLQNKLKVYCLKLIGNMVYIQLQPWFDSLISSMRPREFSPYLVLSHSRQILKATTFQKSTLLGSWRAADLSQVCVGWHLQPAGQGGGGLGTRAAHPWVKLTHKPDRSLTSRLETTHRT